MMQTTGIDVSPYPDKAVFFSFLYPKTVDISHICAYLCTQTCCEYTLEAPLHTKTYVVSTHLKRL